METSLKQIETWSKTAGIPVFPSEKDEKCVTIDWKWQEEDNQKSLSEFLDFLSSIEPKFVMLEYDRFDLTVLESDYQSTTRNIKKADESEVLKRFRSIFKSLKEKDGRIYFLELSFAHSGFCFSFRDFADWSSEYSEFSEIVKEFRYYDITTDRHVINDDALKLAKELANYDVFKEAKNKAQREIAASLFFKNQIIGKRIGYNMGSIIEYADSIKKMGIEKIID